MACPGYQGGHSGPMGTEVPKRVQRQSHGGGLRASLYKKPAIHKPSSDSTGRTCSFVAESTHPLLPSTQSPPNFSNRKSRPTVDEVRWPRFVYPCYAADDQNHAFAFAVVFSARQHAERAICYRPSVRSSVCLSVRLSVTRVDQSKTIDARIMQFSPYSSPIPLVFAG